MRKNGFNFKWKVVENYAAAAVGLIFLWLFVNGIVNSDQFSFLISILIIAIAPFLIAYLDKKSVDL